jgi:hypothetical protein
MPLRSAGIGGDVSIPRSSVTARSRLLSTIAAAGAWTIATNAR